jgi:alkaline phosphatase D
MNRVFVLWLALVATCSVAKEKPVATIALLSDTHTMAPTSQHDGVYEQHFEQAIAAVNKANVDFVLITGDLSNGGQPEQLREFRNHTKKFKAPVYYVPGNHDVGNKFNSGKTNGTITIERLKAYEREMGPSFFAKDDHGVRLIGLNASLFGSGFQQETEQWKFLKTELAKTSDTPKLLFMHYPLFVTNPTERGGGYWNVEPEPRQRVLNLCKNAGVKAVLTGHLHKPLTNEYEGILLLGTPAISFGFPRDAHLEGWTLVTIPKTGPIKFEEQRLDQK